MRNTGRMKGKAENKSLLRPAQSRLLVKAAGLLRPSASPSFCSTASLTKFLLLWGFFFFSLQRGNLFALFFCQEWVNCWSLRLSAPSSSSGMCWFAKSEMVPRPCPPTPPPPIHINMPKEFYKRRVLSMSI